MASVEGELVKTGYFVMRGRVDSHQGTDGMYCEPFHAGAPDLCPYCGKWMSAEEWLEPCLAELEQWGHTYDDIVGGVLAHGFLFSARLIQEYSRYGLSGFREFKPVEIVKVTGPRRSLRPVPRYSWSKAHFDGSRMDPIASGVVWDFDNPLWAGDPETRRNASERKSNFCWYSGTGIYQMKRLVLIAETLTGADAFMVANLPGHTVVSERFRDLIIENGFRGPRLTPIGEYRVGMEQDGA